MERARVAEADRDYREGQAMAFDGEAFVREFMKVWDEHDVNGILDMFTDDVVFEAPSGKEPWGARFLGKAASREFITELFKRIPDAHYEELRHFVCPDHVVVELVRTGTPRGGTRSEDHLVDILTIRDGKIAAMRAYGKAML